jgi:hypothetical protein
MTSTWPLTPAEVTALGVLADRAEPLVPTRPGRPSAQTLAGLARIGLTVSERLPIPRHSRNEVTGWRITPEGRAELEARG